MSLISNTKEEIEEHSTQAGAHHSRPSAGTSLADNSGVFDLLFNTPFTTDANDNLDLALSGTMQVDANGALDVAPATVDADTVDGKHASDLGASNDQIHEQALAARWVVE